MSYPMKVPPMEQKAEYARRRRAESRKVEA